METSRAHQDVKLSRIADVAIALAIPAVTLVAYDWWVRRRLDDSYYVVFNLPLAAVAGCIGAAFWLWRGRKR